MKHIRFNIGFRTNQLHTCKQEKRNACIYIKRKCSTRLEKNTYNKHKKKIQVVYRMIEKIKTMYKNTNIELTTIYQKNLNKDRNKRGMCSIHYFSQITMNKAIENSKMGFWQVPTNYLNEFMFVSDRATLTEKNRRIILIQCNKKMTKKRKSWKKKKY